jgi:DNA mismatch endonuclease (patch repair protein)
MSNYQRLHIKYRWLENLNLNELIQKVLITNITYVAKELNVSRHALQSHLNRNGFFQNNKFKRPEPSWNKGLTKETSKSLQKLSKSVSEIVQKKYENGYINPFKGKHHTETYKQNKSELELQPERIEQHRQYNKEHFDIVSAGGKIGGRFNKGRKHSEETNQKTSKTLKQLTQSGNLFYLRGVKASRKKGETKIERIFREQLILLKLNFKQECRILNSLIDFYLPDKKICIFVDGCYYHACSICFNWNKIDLTKRLNKEVLKARERDKRITDELTKTGYKVYRFWEHDINASVKNCIDKIVF